MDPQLEIDQVIALGIQKGISLQEIKQAILAKSGLPTEEAMSMFYNALSKADQGKM